MEPLDRNQFRPYRNYRWEYVIDSEKGVYVDSRTMNQAQYVKYFGQSSEELGERGDLNYRQKLEFFFYYTKGEDYLYRKRRINISNITRMLRLTNEEITHRHLDQIFGKNLAYGMLAQDPRFGFYRSNENVQRITKYFVNRCLNAINLGLNPYIRPATPREKEQEVHRIAGVLRERYLAKPAPAAAVDAE